MNTKIAYFDEDIRGQIMNRTKIIADGNLPTIREYINESKISYSYYSRVVERTLTNKRE